MQSKMSLISYNQDRLSKSRIMMKVNINKKGLIFSLLNPSRGISFRINKTYHKINKINNNYLLFLKIKIKKINKILNNNNKIQPHNLIYYHKVNNKMYKINNKLTNLAISKFFNLLQHNNKYHNKKINKINNKIFKINK